MNSDSESEDEMEETVSTWEHFPAWELQESMVNIIISPCGSGKTSAIKKYLEDNTTATTTVIVLTFRQTLAMKLSENLQCKNYMLMKEKRFIDIHEEKKIVISPESLGRLLNQSHLFLPEILVIDEWMSFLEHLFNEVTMNQHKRSLVFNFLVAMLAAPDKTVIISDAYIQEESIQTFERVCSLKAIPFSRFRIIRNLWKPVEVRKIYYTHSYRKWKQLLDFATVNKSENLYVFSNWKSILDGLQHNYSGFFGSGTQSFPRKVFNSSYYLSSDSSVEQKEETSKNPDDIWIKFNYVYATPTIAAGISFDEVHFDRAFGFAGPGSTSALSLLQLMYRVRSLRKSEVILYCFRSYSDSKAKNADRRRKTSTYTYDEVVALLQKSSDIISKHYLDCRKMGYRYTNVAVEDNFSMKNIVNQFLIEVVLNNLNSKNAFMEEIRRLAVVDNCEFQFIDKTQYKALCGTSSLESSSQEVKEFMVSPERSLSVSKTMEKAAKFRMNLFADWSGFMEFSELITSPMLLELSSFFETWNVLGVYGQYKDMLKNHPDPNIAKQIQFDPLACSSFYNQFIHGNKQTAFFNFISSHIALDLERDAIEYKTGGFSTNSIELILLNELIQIFRISPTSNYEITDWFGNASSVSFKGNIWKDVIPLEPEKPLNQQSYIEEAATLKKICQSMFSSYHEIDINNEESISKLHALFTKYWSVIVASRTLLTAENLRKLKTKSGDSDVVPFLRPGCTYAQKSYLVDLACMLIRKLLGKIGLSLTKVTTTRQNVFNSERRIVFRSYKISKFKERLMLSVLRYLQEANKSPITVTHYPMEDPFHLLVYNPRDFLLRINRFKPERRSYYRNIAEYLKETMRFDSEIDIEFGSPGILPIDHIFANLQNIVIHCFIWKFYNGDPDDKFTQDRKIFTPIFQFEEFFKKSYIEYTYIPDSSRIEIAKGNHTSESFDELTLDEQQRLLAELKDQYPDFDTTL